MKYKCVECSEWTTTTEEELIDVRVCGCCAEEIQHNQYYYCYASLI